jgi:hypothetical protein
LILTARSGVILILGLGALSTYTGYVLGEFKLRYPEVYSMADAGEMLAGPIGREILGTGQLLFLIFIMGGHILTFTKAMNALTDHGTCTIVFGIVGMVVSFICTLPRTMISITWLAGICKMFLYVLMSISIKLTKRSFRQYIFRSTSDHDRHQH